MTDTAHAGGDRRTPAAEQPHMRKAEEMDVHELALSLADAFYEDPVFGWLMPDQKSRSARLRRFFAIELRHVALERGRAWTVDELVGAAITTPPGAWRMPPMAALTQGATFGLRLARAGRLLAAVERQHLREPHYYFAAIGVRREMQGNGLGSALMGPTLKRCDRERLPAYLEASSERSAALYERLGFHVTRELRLGSSPPLWLMLRPPDSATGRS